MSRRNHASARKAGTAFETLVADYLATHVDDRIERRARTGAKDRGDIGGLRHMGARVVIECKNWAKPQLGAWCSEAETERGNDGANAALIVHKRHGKGRAEDQWVTLTLGDLVALLNGHRGHIDTKGTTK